MVIVKGTSEARMTGLVAVRIAWITAIVVCAAAMLIGLFTGTGTGTGGDPSQQLPGFAFSAGRDSSQRLPAFSSFDPVAATVGAAAQEDRSGRAKEGAPGDSHPASGVPPRSGTQPEDAGGRTLVITPRPKPPRAPEGDPAEAPQAPPVSPAKPPPAPPVSRPQPPPEPPVISPGPTPEPPVTPPEPSKPPKAPKPPKPEKPPKA